MLCILTLWPCLPFLYDLLLSLWPLSLSAWPYQVINCKCLGRSHGRKGLFVLPCSIAPPRVVSSAICIVVALWKCKAIKWMCVGMPTAMSKPTPALMYMHPSRLHGLL